MRLILPLATLLVLAAPRSTSAQAPARVITQGEAVPDHQKAVPVADDSKGSTCAYSAAGALKNDLVPAELRNCAIVYQRIVKDQLATQTLGGKGGIASKFKLENQQLVGQNDHASSSTFANFEKANETRARGYSVWTSQMKGAQNPIVDLYASAGVTRKDAKTSPAGQGAAQTNDPLVFDFATAGSLDFDFLLGGVPGLVEPDPEGPSPRVALGSDDPAGLNVLTFSAAFTGVSFGGQSLNGELFRLIIQSEGVLLSPSQLDIRFLPWSGLGLSDADVAEVVAYVRGAFHVLGDGAIGLDPGEQVALIGAGGPIATLSLDHGVGRVTSATAVGAVAAVVPEPATGVLVTVGLAALGGARGRARRRVRDVRRGSRAATVRASGGARRPT